MEPYQTGRGFELKVQLIRASIAIMEAIWSVAPDARFVHVDPLVNVVAHPSHPQDAAAAEAYRLSQYQAWDMLAGRLWPGLGGREEFLDIIGVNYYPHNQWFYDIRGGARSYEFEELHRENPCYRPLRNMLREVHERYRRPIIIAETGTEDEVRPDWFNYVYHEAAAALDDGIPLEGICLYPILNHPGWVDDRHCHNGLWDYADDAGNRQIYQPLAEELHKARKFFDKKLGLEQMA
jgi:hypothetical protein